MNNPWTDRTTSRRRFLAVAAAAAVGSGLTVPHLMALAAPAVQPFTFLFFTDAHLEPELDATKGTAMAFRHSHGVKADFAINGGDHVFDVNKVSKERAVQLYDLFGKAEQDLGLKVYHTVGNHDVFAVSPDNPVAPWDPLYGKRIYEERFGKTYYRFDHKGCHFFVLDSVDIRPDRTYRGFVDAAQIGWLRSALATVPPNAPIILVVHYPVVTAFAQYEAPSASADQRHGLALINSNEVLDVLYGHNVIGVLQGHTHVNEQVIWRGIPFYTSGAVSGNWWQGTRMGTPEGYTVVSVADGKMTVRYETYGFRSVDPHNT